MNISIQCLQYLWYTKSFKIPLLFSTIIHSFYLIYSPIEPCTLTPSPVLTVTYTQTYRNKSVHAYIPRPYIYTYNKRENGTHTHIYSNYLSREKLLCQDERHKTPRPEGVMIYKMKSLCLGRFWSAKLAITHWNTCLYSFQLTHPRTSPRCT